MRQKKARNPLKKPEIHWKMAKVAPDPETERPKQAIKSEKKDPAQSELLQDMLVLIHNFENLDSDEVSDRSSQ